MPIVFSTPSIAPLDALLTLGVSVKETSSPIGYFGTGFKYAIATLLRTNHSITLLLGETPYTFSSRPSTIRNKTFQIVTLHKCHLLEGPARDLGFTTDLGKDWTPFEAFRELHSNTLDEGGETYESETSPLPSPSHTKIIVTGPGIENAYYSREEIFPDFSPLSLLEKTSRVEIYNRPASGIYYRGVLAARLPQEKSLFSYNIISGATLTEDRTLRPFDISYRICHALNSLTNPVAIALLHARGENAWENTLNFSLVPEFSNEVVSTTKDRLKSGLPILDSWTASILSRLAPSQLDLEETPLNSRESSLLADALHILSTLSLPPTHPIKITPTLPKQALGLAYNSTIYLSRDAFSHGDLSLAATILEEETHLTTGFPDGSRQLQDHFLRLILTTALNLKAKLENPQ